MSANVSNSGIHVAAYFGMVNPIKQLINNGTDVNFRNEDGNTPLIATILGEGNKYQKREIFDFLISSGADVNIINRYGDTALHTAVRAVNACTISSKFVQQLLDHGADKMIKNRSKLTASQLAFQLGNTKLGDALLCHDGVLANISFKNKSNLRILFRDVLSFVFPVFAFRSQLSRDLAKMNLQLPSCNTLRAKKKIDISAPIAPPVIAQPYGGCTVLNQLPQQNIKKKIDISAPIAPPVIAQPYGGCTVLNQLPQQPTVNSVDNMHMAQRNHMSPPQPSQHQNHIHYEKHSEQVDYLTPIVNHPLQQQQQWQPQPQATYEHLYQADGPSTLSTEDNFHKQLNIHQPPPY